MKEKETNKRIMIGEVIIAIVFIIAVVSLILIAGFIDMPIYLKIIIIVSAVILMLAGLIGLIILDCHVGYFECPECHERFVPSLRDYIFGMHTIKKRYLKCPKCGKKFWCTKKTTSKEN